MRARRARGIPAYAASRVNACLIACSRSPGKREPVRRRMKSRSSSSAKSASPPISSRTGASQNTRPITDAACSAAFSRAGSRSMRAASTPRTESGIESCSGSAATSHRSSRCARTPLSTSDSISSSTKNGLPSERRTSRSRTCSGRSATSSRGDLVGERLELDRGHVPAAASPLELGPGGGDDQQRAAHVAHRPLEQLEQRRLGPVDVLHEQDDRPMRAGLVQELDPGVPETVARSQRVQVAGDVAAEREAEDRAIVERAGLLLEDLPNGPVRPRRPVREAPADAERRALRPSLEPRPELAQKAALAHAGIAEDDRELRLAALDRAFVGAAEGVELVTAPDERPLVGAARPDCRQRPHEQPARDGLALPLRVDVLQVAELERAPGRLRGPLAHDDLRRGRLPARGARTR